MKKPPPKFHVFQARLGDGLDMGEIHWREVPAISAPHAAIELVTHESNGRALIYANVQDMPVDVIVRGGPSAGVRRFRVAAAPCDEMHCCIGCGCTEFDACDPPCSWARPNLCSACAPRPKAKGKSMPTRAKLTVDKASIEMTKAAPAKKRAPVAAPSTNARTRSAETPLTDAQREHLILLHRAKALAETPRTIEQIRRAASRNQPGPSAGVIGILCDKGLAAKKVRAIAPGGPSRCMHYWLSAAGVERARQLTEAAATPAAKKAAAKKSKARARA